MRFFAISLFTLFLAACVTVIPPSQGIQSGNIAFKRGDYAQAKESFSSALQLATQQNWKPHIATAKYGLGRSLSQLCQFDEAEKYLMEAASLESEISGGKGINLSQDYFELARFYYEYDKFDKAVPYFQKAIPLAEELRIASSDPIGYANVLEDYAIALSKAGDANQAKVIEKKIAALRQSNPGKSAGFKIVRVNPQCLPNSMPQRDAPQAARP